MKLTVTFIAAAFGSMLVNAAAVDPAVSSSVASSTTASAKKIQIPWPTPPAGIPNYNNRPPRPTYWNLPGYRPIRPIVPPYGYPLYPRPNYGRPQQIYARQVQEVKPPGPGHHFGGPGFFSGPRPDGNPHTNPHTHQGPRPDAPHFPRPNQPGTTTTASSASTSTTKTSTTTSPASSPATKSSSTSTSTTTTKPVTTTATNTSANKTGTSTTKTTTATSTSTTKTTTAADKSATKTGTSTTKTTTATSTSAAKTGTSTTKTTSTTKGTTTTASSASKAVSSSTTKTTSTTKASSTTSAKATPTPTPERHHNPWARPPPRYNPWGGPSRHNNPWGGPSRFGNPWGKHAGYGNRYNWRRSVQPAPKKVTFPWRNPMFFQCSGLPGVCPGTGPRPLYQLRTPGQWKRWAPIQPGMQALHGALRGEGKRRPGAIPQSVFSPFGAPRFYGPGRMIAREAEPEPIWCNPNTGVGCGRRYPWNYILA